MRWFLSRDAEVLIEDVANERQLSVASPWQVAIKVGTGKMTLVKPVRQFLTEQLSCTQTQLLPITLDHAAVVATLPRHHGDPFDRLIISQAMVEDLIVVSIDAAFDACAISRRW